ncbi:antitoxin Xre/MbcA/ParS toxin-binding domain-containing protein [Pseudomonas sp. TMW22090]|uniref:antitoxin Xre/MbcA/ParS toxin-binding domain-containing protein n=1 Tax=Pseudomonas sp. TMW22090 TaxID=2506434 RepID=UPI001F0E3A4A
MHLGLPFHCLNRIANILPVERKDISQAIGLSPASHARRVKTGRFSTVESDRLIALIAVFENALTLFEDDVTATTERMSSPARGLGSKRPVEMLRTSVETNAVLDFIGRLQRGVFV